MDYCLFYINKYVVDPYILGATDVVYETPNEMRAKYGSDVIPWNPEYSFWRQFFVLWFFIFFSGWIVYVIMSTITYNYYYRTKPDGTNDALFKFGGEGPYQVRNELWTSTWSLFLMAGMTVPVEMLSIYGYGFVYYNVSDYGWAYLLISPILFIIFSDTLIYWAHRWLHHPYVYWVHKLHHYYKHTTPFSAFAFHPLDGYMQGLPYHLFPLFFPFHNYLYAFALATVGLWTINIHDRVTFAWRGVNGAAHHTVHHTKFNYNYGQYFIFWDYYLGTFLDPFDEEPYKNTPQAKAIKLKQKKL